MNVAKSLVASFIIATTMIGLGSAQTAHAEETKKKDNQPKIVEVAVGDTLSKIAEANATTYLRIFYANADIADPDVINPGQKVRIPTAEEQLAERALPAKVVAPAVSYSSYRATAPRTTTVSLPADANVWDRLAQCESGGNWGINTGNGYSGGLQFNPGTWRANGGTGQAWQASREEQIRVAENIRAARGFNPWPACSAKLGLR
jgi:LysM repeat protein